MVFVDEIAAGAGGALLVDSGVLLLLFFELENRLTRVSQKIDLIYFIHQAIPVHVQVTSNLRQRCLGAKGAIVSTGY